MLPFELVYTAAVKAELGFTAAAVSNPSVSLIRISPLVRVRAANPSTSISRAFPSAPLLPAIPVFASNVSVLSVRVIVAALLPLSVILVLVINVKIYAA